MPDEVSKKSLKVLDKKLQLLAEHAEFHVNINSVVGGGIHNPHDALVVGRRAVQLGFTSTIGIIHDGDGQLRPLGPTEREVFLEMKNMTKRHYSRFNWFQNNIADGKPNDWRCRAGARYLYICEDGLGALLLAAARPSGHTAGKILRRRHPARVSDRKRMRAELHGFMRAPSVVHGPLARAADPSRTADTSQRRAAGPDRVAGIV